jgi:hypothetical protein
MEIDHVCNENIIYADPTTQKKYKNLACVKISVIS